MQQATARAMEGTRGSEEEKRESEGWVGVVEEKAHKVVVTLDSSG